jgi:glycine betaine catabolism B
MTLLERMNAALRPVSMYKGILFGLVGIWLAAVALASFGALSITPLSLIVSGVVACGATLLGSLGASRLFSVHSQIDSSIITGLILTLIITPSLGVPNLVVLGFAGIVAGVSKYVIVWRGRHIFNPAALTAVVISLTGLGTVSWWVATPILTPLVALVGLMALYQTKRFAMAAIFLGISVPIVLIQLLSYGATLGQSFALLLSWPLIFIVGVMLVEPLTLPPRKWQVYLVAAVVAVLVALPFQIGPLAMTPALALLIGNALAAFLAHRRAVQLTFTGREQLTPTSYEFFFTPSQQLSFEPGQFIEISLPHRHTDLKGERRSFSITSAPGSKQLSLGIKFYQPSSSFKKAFLELKKGNKLQIIQRAGDFVLPKDSKKPLLFVAGGIGITPFISQLRSLQEKQQTRDIVVVYTMGSGEEFAYKKVLSSPTVKGVVVSPDQPKATPSHWHYLPGNRIDFDMLSEYIPNLDQRDVYISGPTPFVQSASFKLRQKGTQRIVTDYFVGY